MIVDIGGGTTDVAVISLSGVVESASIKIAGDQFNEAVIKYIRRKHNVLIGERTAEELKMSIGCVYPREEEQTMEIKGRDLMTGLPRAFTVSSSEMIEAFEEPTMRILEAVHSVLERTSGLAGNAEITEQNADYAVFRQALYIVMMNLTRKLAKDGEGASKLLECTVSGAKDLDTAIIIAKSVICSPLFKCAMFGADANWGRVLCAVGYAPAEFDIHAVSVTLASRAGSVLVCEHGAGVAFSEEEAKKILLEDEIQILVSVGDGAGTATAWGCDLTYDYVKINGDYRS